MVMIRIDQPGNLPGKLREAKTALSGLRGAGARICASS